MKSALGHRSVFARRPITDQPRARIGALAASCTVALAVGVLGAVPAYAAGPETHTIAEVQGTGAASPLVGETVTVHGVVTADYRTGGYNGLVIQTQGSGGDSDATPGASDGIFVFLGGSTVDAPTRGDLISVTGEVSEYFGQTQITIGSAADIEIEEAGVGLPEPTPLPADVVGDAREAYESMLVAPTGDYFVASSHQLWNFGTLWLNPGELNVKSTEQVRPGAAADEIAAANRASRILLDDGWSRQTTHAEHTGEQPYFTADEVVRNGDQVVFADAGYVLQYGFDDWRLQPVVPIDDSSDAEYVAGFESANARSATPPSVGGDFQVAAFNVFNYFTTLRDDNSAARGAANAAQFETQKSKIVAAINDLDADVVALMEIENSIKLGGAPDAALADLVAGLNAEAGAGVWDYVATPAELTADITDFITNGIIYKTDAVTPVGDAMTIIDEAVWDNAREPIAQTFDADGRIVTVIANHFKSKSGDGAEPADGQGHFNADRVEQAESLLDLVAQVQAASESDDVLLAGDFNAYSQEDPIQVFAEAGFVNLVDTRASGQYTYTFDGELGSLDHILASESLVDSITGVGVWEINSAEWSDRGYAYDAAEAGTPFRSSDHDPIVVGVSSTVPPVVIDVFTINDFHGRIEADGRAAGGAVLSGAVNQMRANNPNTIFAANGDLIGGSTFTSFIQNDEPTIDVLNEIGLDVSSMGNHEFDQGWDDLSGRVDDRANWPYLGANVFLAGTNEHAGDAYWIRELDGVRVGFIGAVTEELPTLVSPAGIAAIEVRDIAESVNAVADQLTDGDDSNGEADVLILLVHEGAATTQVDSITPTSPIGRVLENLSDDIKAVSTSHTHLVYNHVIDGRPVFQGGQYGENYAHTTLRVDPTTKELISIENEIKPLTADGAGLYPADPAVQEIVDEATAVADVLGAEPVGSVAADFLRAVQSDGTSENRGGESTIGNFVAEVHRWATNADIGLMNPGGIRQDIRFGSSGDNDADGNVTFKEAAIVQPFANTLVTVELTGAQLKSVLEEQWQPEGLARPFLKLGVSNGFSYTYDPNAAAGERILSMTLRGEAIDPAAVYVVGLNSFLADGGDNFTTFTEGAARRDSGRIDLQSMVDWFAENGTATPDFQQRAVGVVVSPPAGGSGYVAGEQISIDLSSLVFSSESPLPETVVVSLGGEVLASSAIDPTIIDAYDEAGQATLSFAAPAGFSGEQIFTILVPDNGTLVQIPVTFASGGSGDGGSGSGDGGGGSGDGPDEHPETGGEVGPYPLIGGVLLALGLGLMLARRRRSVIEQ